MPKFQDLTGQRFGRLTVIKQAEDHICPNGQHKTQWLCRCECGNEVIILANSLKSGRTTSCGCILKKHGLRNTRLYYIWRDMKKRCYNPNNKGYKNYGGRGINVCKEWLDDFQNFYNWSIANGYDDKAKYGVCTIDRIDVNGNYEPSNCRWVDMKIQSRNRRDNVNVTINRQTHCLKDWCKILNLNYLTVHKRINNLHWSVEKALTI